MSSRSHNALLLTAASLGVAYAARATIRRTRKTDFRGKVVFITGASRGLGLLLARELAAEGAHLALCARDEGELDRARDDLRKFGGDVLLVTCDVTRRDQVEQAIAQANAHFGRIDVLINNAGTITVGPVEVMTLGDYEQAMATHFWGPLYATLAVLPQMRARRDGRIINISSIGGKVPVPHLVPYVASKFALTGLSESLRTELLREGIYVTTVCPGLIRTGSPRNAQFKGQHRAEYAWFTIGDSLPMTSMSATRAARQIVRASRYGEAEVILSIQAQLAARFHGLFPGLSTDLTAQVARLMPGAGKDGLRAFAGKESQSIAAPSLLTALSDKAAIANNQME